MASNNFSIITGIFSISLGSAVISPSANPSISIIPASIIKSRLSSNVSAINTTASTICGINVGSCCPIPVINETIIIIPA